MFDSDSEAWPDAIGLGIAAIEEASFLTDRQKDKIFYLNAIRFLRLK